KNPIKKGEKILTIIGPEGGFSHKEFDYFKSKSLPLISLGDLILKAETAVIMTLGSIVYEYQG
ncbi:RsmE family RNA methyltransferase, partial [bacterium]|nr:RsmE family RNA methyltransferase [bacterium]